MNMKTCKPDFALVERFGPPARQDRGFGFRRDSDEIKGGLKALWRLFSEGLTRRGMPLFGFGGEYV